ncbi:PIN domain-containing protein [Candidatus Woesearchaeota archaeon]|nr:PIN domain-containing protein [Candidatus Woesearchaeota archaeon]
MTKYYFDTCIWRDYYENREDNFRPLGEWALLLIKSIEEDNGFILYSNLIVHELKKEYNETQIKELFSVTIKLREVPISKIQVQEARMINQIRKVGFADAMHVVLARDNNAILVTRDNHFIDLTDIAPIKKPEELL